MQRRLLWPLLLVLALAGCTPAARSAPSSLATAAPCPPLPTLRVVVGSIEVSPAIGSREWVTACPANGTFTGYAADSIPAVLLAKDHAAPTVIPTGATGRLVFDLAPIAGTTQLLRWDDQSLRYLPTPLPLAPDGSFALPTDPGVYGYGVRAQWHPLPGFSGEG